MRETRRYLGLDLAGAKNQKTALAVLEHYPKEQKIFLLDIFDKIGAAHPEDGGKSGDQSLLELIGELTEGARPSAVKMGVNVPLQLPPCLLCNRKSCSPSGQCTSPEARWMREFTKKASRGPIRVLEFTPYTQRPVELWLRYKVMPKLPEGERIEIDETLGGNKAPLTARMQYLKRHIGKIQPIEIWPKLSTMILAHQLGLSRRVITTYRRLEEGLQARETIIETLAAKHGIFIYDRDVKKVTHSLTCFDAFICAYTALLSEQGRCQKPPAGFPVQSGWIHYPAFTEFRS